jgi:hyperosmotically inducible protein
MNPNRIRQALALAFAGAFVAGIVGCSDRPKHSAGTAPQSVGQKVDQATARLKEKTAEVTREVKEKTAEATAELKEKTAEVTKDVKEATAEVKKDVKDATADLKLKEMSGDALITAKVKTALIAEPGLSAMKIDVDTDNGIVTLKGTVDSIDKSSRARQLAGSVDGVSSVNNRLIVGGRTTG